MRPFVRSSSSSHPAKRRLSSPRGRGDNVATANDASLRLQPQAKAMPSSSSTANCSSQQTPLCHTCASQSSIFNCDRCNLPTCNSCRFRRWKTCKACFWTKEAANLLSTGSPAHGLKKRIAAKMEFEDKFWKAFLTVEGKPNAMSLAAVIASGGQAPSAELCSLCEDNQQRSAAIAQCARCKKLLCENCIEDFPSCQCLACHILSIHAKAASHQKPPYSPNLANPK